MQHSELPFKLLLFIDKRPNSADQIRQIRRHIKQLSQNYGADQSLTLEVVDVSEQPSLAERFKLVVTPALVKVSPQGQQVLTGSDMISLIDQFWDKWLAEAEPDYHANGLDQDDLDQDDLDQDGLDQDGLGQGGIDQGGIDQGGIEKDALATLESSTSEALASTSDQPNAPSATLASLAQLTELIRLSDEIFQLKQTRAELEDQLKFNNHIIAMLAHDLRNPLTAASIAIETLEMGYSPNSARHGQINADMTAQLLKHAKTQIRSIDRMITDILQAARGSSAEIQMQPKQINLYVICMDVLDAMRSKIESKNQTIATDLPQDLPSIYADFEQVRRVMTNLLDNAVKYTPAEGHIKISALHRTTQKVQVSIQDTGPGIPEDNQARIFEESFRLQRDRLQDGYGLGLALCLRIIRAHYGQIWVDSAPGEGSTFHFTLPVYREVRLG
jgi:two-component system, OmpR family, clock-associated histidine kinase SasA